MRLHYRKAQRVKNSLLRFFNRIGNRRMCADMALRNESVRFRSLLSRNVYGISNGLEKFGIPQIFGLFVTAGISAGRHKGSFIVCLFDLLIRAYTRGRQC